jgi:hypothetical protein
MSEIWSLIACFSVEREPKLFDVVIYNKDLDTAYNEFLKAIDAELKQVRQVKTATSEETEQMNGTADAANSSSVR